MNERASTSVAAAGMPAAATAGGGGTAGMLAGRIVLCLFDTVAEAGQALEDLIEIGAPTDGISLVARQDAGPNRTLRAMSTASAASFSHAGRAAALKSGGAAEPDIEDGMPRPADEGRVREEGAGVLWARLARLGITLDFLPLPGIGWAMAAGPLSAVLRSPEAGLGWGAALLGAAFGPTAAGLTGTLVHLGVPEEDARLYVEGVRLGGILLLVPAEEEARVEDVKAVLHYNNALGFHEREFTPSRPMGLSSSPGPRPAPTATAERTPLGQSQDTDGEAETGTGDEDDEGKPSRRSEHGRMDRTRAGAHRAAEGIIVCPADLDEGARPEPWPLGEAMVGRFPAVDAVGAGKEPR